MTNDRKISVGKGNGEMGRFSNALKKRNKRMTKSKRDHLREDKTDETGDLTWRVGKNLLETHMHHRAPVQGPFTHAPCLPRYPLEIKTHPTRLESRAGGDRLCRPAAGSRWLARCRVAFDLGPRGKLNIIGVLRRFHLSAVPWSRCSVLAAYGCFI